jgi:trigger factor
MKILKQERQGNLVSLEVEVLAKDLKEAEKQTLANAAKNLKIPGFRKGKAPKAMVEKAFDQQAVRNQAVQDLIGDLYPEIIKKSGIKPVDFPKLDVKPPEEDQPFTFKIQVEVYPEVKLGKYKGIKLDKLSADVSEEEVEKALGNIQNRFARPIEVSDRGCQNGDNVTLEIQAEAQGAAIKRWPRKLQFLPVGSGYISPEFDKEITGLKTGEDKEFKVKFSDKHTIKEIAGKEVSFKVKIEKIHNRELLPLDDEFAKKVSSFGTLAELKEEIKRSIEEQKKQASEADLKNKTIEEISKNAKLELPEALVKIEQDELLEELKGSLSRSNLTLEAYLKGVKKSEEELLKEFEKPATARAKGKVVLKEVAEQEKLSVTPQEFEKEVEIIAQSAGKDPKQYKKSLHEGGRTYIEDYILRRKALDLIIEQAKITEKEEKK